MIALCYGYGCTGTRNRRIEDSITPYGARDNGFTFANYNSYAMLYVFNQALQCTATKRSGNNLFTKR